MTELVGSSAAGYAAFLDAAREAEGILKSHPDATEETLADAHVYLAGMWHFYIARFFKGGDVNRPCFVRDMESFRTWGLPTPNHHYFSAEIDGEGTYRISGQRGNVADYCFEVVSGLAGDRGEVGRRIDAFEGKSLVTNADGSFELYVGGERSGPNWMKAGPDAGVIFVRQTVDDWRVEAPTPMLIERIDTSAGDEPFVRPTPDAVRRLYERAGRGLVDHVGFLHEFALNWGKVLPLNQLDAPSVGPADAGYFPGQFNTKCRWEIAPGKALVISLRPAAAAYQSLDLAHPLWFNSIYPREVSSSRTIAQSRVSSDGLYHFVISTEDPGVFNWLDTAGLHKGFLFVRWQRVLGQGPEQPVVKLVDLSELGSALPVDEHRVSPEERAQERRERRLSMDKRYA